MNNQPIPLTPELRELGLEIDLAQALACDEANLHAHLERHPGVYAHVSSLAASAAEAVRDSERARKVAFAVADKEVRDEIERAGEKKPPEDAIKARVAVSPRVEQAEAAYSTAQRKSDVFSGLLEALRQRGRILQELSALRRSEIPQSGVHAAQRAERFAALAAPPAVYKPEPAAPPAEEPKRRRLRKPE